MKRAVATVALCILAAVFVSRGQVNVSQPPPSNLSQIGGTAALSGGASGSLAIGGTAANNAAITQNPDLVGAETIATGSNPSAASTGNQRRLLADLDGALFIRPGGPNLFSCVVTMSSKTTTQCEAAPASGLKAYITDVQMGTTTAGSATTIQVEYGTGTNCATTAVALSPTYPNTAIASAAFDFTTPLVPVAADEICVVQAGTTAGTTSVTLQGYIAP